MKKCPESIIAVGAASVLLRHEILAKEATPDSFKALWTAFENSKAAVRDLGIAHMELAAGELDFDDAEEVYFYAADPVRAERLARRGHCAWKFVLDRHGIENPTNEQICAIHKAMCDATPNPSETLRVLARGNFR